MFYFFKVNAIAPKPSLAIDLIKKMLAVQHFPKENESRIQKKRKNRQILS